MLAGPAPAAERLDGLARLNHSFECCRDVCSAPGRPPCAQVMSVILRQRTETMSGKLAVHRYCITMGRCRTYIGFSQ